MTDRQKVIKDCVRYSAVTVIGQGVGLIRAIFIPVLLTPLQFGIWNLMNVIVSYGSNAHLGVLDGMNKLIPMLRGQGQESEAEVIKDSAFWVNVFLSAGWGLVIWIASYAVPPLYTVALRITALVVFLLGLFSYYFSLLRADNRFTLVSAGVGGLSILSAVLILTLGYFSADRLSGVLIGLTISYVLILFFWFFKGQYRFGLRLNGLAVRRSFSTGAPLLITGVLSVLFLSVDRWVIASKLGVAMVGYYAIGILVSNLIGLIPGSIASVLYPKMLERFGATGRSTTLMSLLDGPVRVVVMLLSLLIGGCILILPQLIKFFLPKYLPSVPFLGILVSAAFFFGAASVPGNFIIAVNKQKPLIAIQVAAILLAVTMDFVAVQMGWGLIGVAWSTAGAYLVYGGGYMFLAAYFAFESRAEMTRFLVDVYALFAAMVLGLVLTMTLVPDGETAKAALAFTTLRFLLFISILLPALWWCNRDGKVMSVIRNELVACPKP
ncbi:MAG: oligosaccharide flippase family protein [bacterium]|nr:oligosaccharide flippase family protein [bacterium]